MRLLGFLPDYEQNRRHKDCAETKKSRRGERKVAEVVKELREWQSGEEEIGEFRHGEADVAEEGRAEENAGGDDGTGGREAAASGADGEAKEDAEEVRYYEVGMVRDGEWDEKTKCVDAGDADYNDYVNDAAGVEEKPVEEASDNRAENSDTSQISDRSERAGHEKPNEEFATSVLEPYNGPSPSETMHWTMAEPTPVYAERFDSGKYKDEEADRNYVKGIEPFIRWHHVSSQATRYDHVICALPPALIAIIRDFLRSPPAGKPAELIRRSESEQRTQQQSLTAMKLGDRQPTELLRRMRHLIGDLTAALVALILFLQRLHQQCTNRAVKDEISLHSFPLDARLKKEWVVKLRIGKPVTPPMKNQLLKEHVGNLPELCMGYLVKRTPMMTYVM
ncbi:hypothetical protein HPB52_003219 [Rhipicephalus sanguineus]|uniref:Uncharacterized protein n=1 Tax=Rhipicephalus sanguineus TaxID=34632 RepID=A0A9D4QAS5_RHISA|nr:hypothetical protein HPB52_003219 [Rhipicephalus sanguineus]